MDGLPRTRGVPVDVSDRTLSALGFDDVRAAIGARCRTEVGRERGLKRPFLDGLDAVLASLALVDEARALKREPLSLPLGGLVDLRSAIDRAAKGGMLEPRELMSICAALFAFERTYEVLQERREKVPGLAAIGRRLPLLGRLATRLDRSFEASGEISDRASDELREARERARGLHRRIRGRLDELLRDERFSVNLREGYYSVRNDRYVVPVLSSHQREVEGIVHNASQSGQTLFVEPQELIGLGNELAIAQSVVLEEERKVLLELSGLVAREAGKLEDGLLASAELDELEALARLAEELLATTPAVHPAHGPLAVKGLRHPRLVLKGDQVVANDVDLSQGARALVGSGPNAGGKTVTLTGIGLCALMVRAGLPIPCDAGSSIPLFNQVHSAIGDLQDLEQGLSTFSAHVTVLKQVVASARRGALVLIDEIAADTDPREGAAIATAVLEDLLEKGALVLVTTHLEELKALAHLDPRFVNGRVGFDAKKMAPTYRLQLGVAGASSAIDIARRVGLPEGICVRAQHLAENSGGALSKALQAAEDERRKMLDQRDQAERDAREAQALKARAEAQLAEVEKKKKEEELRFREALRAELDYARAQVRALVERLESDRSDKALKAAKAAAAELTERANEQVVAERAVRAEMKSGPEPLGPLELRVGARARHKSLDAEVEIVDLGQDAVVVTMGALRMRVPASELLPPKKAAAATSRFPSPAGAKDERLKRADASAAKPMTLASPTLDLRGQRAEDALREVERFLDRAARDGEAAVILLHGHGTGALKKEIREALRGSPYAKTFRPGDGPEGGDGVTVVELA
ncbi:MAG: Smr/MutS family protein [Myxococcaceae bacterium]|nr:Smr/MutS family protein [Myxococcaceae bacterium]